MKLVRTVFMPNEFTGYHMLGVMFLFFGTIITVNMILAFSAASTWTGLMVKNSYVESQNFNRRLEELEVQAKLGWTATIDAETQGLQIQLRDSKQSAVKGAIVTGSLGRPVHEGLDQTISFVETENGYQADIELEPGLWRVQLYAVSQEGETWTHTIRFHIKSDAG